MEKEMNPNNPDNLDSGSDSEEEEEARHPLENQFVSMFPFTPRRYIRNRLANIKQNNPDAVARLTEELLRWGIRLQKLVTGMMLKRMKLRKKSRSGRK